MSKSYKSENRIQQECVMDFNNKYPGLRGLLFAVPNGGARSSQEGKLLKQTGVVRGVSDLLFMYNTNTFCFELKTEIGEQSSYQSEWQLKVEAQGFKYYLIRTSAIFMAEISYIIRMYS